MNGLDRAEARQVGLVNERVDGRRDGAHMDAAAARSRNGTLVHAAAGRERAGRRSPKGSTRQKMPRSSIEWCAAHPADCRQLAREERQAEEPSTRVSAHRAIC